jgi:hypothetical protein
MNTSKKIILFCNQMNFSYPPDVVYLFIKLRTLLEEHGLKAKLQTLNLYCNWLVHRELDKSSHSLINRLRDKIKEHMSSGNDFNLSVSYVLGVDKLNEEIQHALSFCQALPEKQQIDWQRLSTTLFVELIDKPCKNPSFRNELGHPDDFYGIKLVEHDGVICWELLSPSLEKINSRIIGPLVRIKNEQT